MQCSSCGSVLKIPNQKLGKRVKCPCGNVMVARKQKDASVQGPKIVVKCPSCKRSLSVPGAAASKRVKCPCGKLIAVKSRSPIVRSSNSLETYNGQNGNASIGDQSQTRDAFADVDLAAVANAPAYNELNAKKVSYQPTGIKKTSAPVSTKQSAVAHNSIAQAALSAASLEIKNSKENSSKDARRQRIMRLMPIPFVCVLVPLIFYGVYSGLNNAYEGYLAWGDNLKTNAGRGDDFYDIVGRRVGGLPREPKEDKPLLISKTDELKTEQQLGLMLKERYPDWKIAKVLHSEDGRSFEVHMKFDPPPVLVPKSGDYLIGSRELANQETSSRDSDEEIKDIFLDSGFMNLNLEVSLLDQKKSGAVLLCKVKSVNAMIPNEDFPVIAEIKKKLPEQGFQVILPYSNQSIETGNQNESDSNDLTDAFVEKLVESRIKDLMPSL